LAVSLRSSIAKRHSHLNAALCDLLSKRSELNNEVWFQLVKQWKDSGRGVYGLTFPFLVGALARIQDREPTKEFITELFASIIDNPVAGFYGEVRWCGNIDEPVISVNPLERLATVSIKDSFKHGEVTTLAFTTDLMNMFHLNCEDAKECLGKLIELTNEITQNSVFSKNAGSFTDFSEDDLYFISEVSGVKIT